MGLLAEALLESTDDPETVHRFGEKMLTESHRLANMVGELIELSRLQGAHDFRISTKWKWMLL